MKKRADKPKKGKTSRLFRGKAPHLSTSKTNALSLPQEFNPTTAGGESGKKIATAHSRKCGTTFPQKNSLKHPPTAKRVRRKKEKV